ncbi:MAG: clan AA aspartic protease [Acidobacteriota bacterium]
MISGYVNSKLEAMVSLPVYGPRGESLDVEALIDTGFAGDLTLPSAEAAALGLESLAAGVLILADGTRVKSELCPATVVWDGQSRIAEVDILESEVLVGMALMEGYDLSVRVAVGGSVTLKPIPPTQ